MTGNLLFDGPADADAVIALAHGAGAPMDTPFMNAVAGGLGDAGIRIARFEFPYMAKRRLDGRRRGPDRPAVLLDCWREIADTLAGPARLFVAGKSMGGRYASLFAAGPNRADETAPASAASNIAGVICLGYPFHPPGKPERLRTDHLARLSVPMLIVQGERDTFGTQAEIAGYALPASIAIVWAPDGDHSFKPRKASGHSEADNLALACTAITRFVAGAA